MAEIWKDIENYEGLYQVSNLGRVKSLGCRVFRKNNTGESSYYLKRERILKQEKSQIYYRVALRKAGGHIKTFQAHTLVWDAFGDKPRNGRKLQVDHIDNNKLDNRIDNLQLLTPRENAGKGWALKRDLPTGVGITKYKKYQARAGLNGKVIYLGNYLTPEEAQCAYNKFVEGVV